MRLVRNWATRLGHARTPLTCLLFYSLPLACPGLTLDAGLTSCTDGRTRQMRAASASRRPTISRDLPERCKGILNEESHFVPKRWQVGLFIQAKAKKRRKPTGRTSQGVTQTGKERLPKNQTPFLQSHRQRGQMFVALPVFGRCTETEGHSHSL